MKKDWIYTRDLNTLVCKNWKPIMKAFIKTVDEYLGYKKDKLPNFYVSYVKDKYGRLRIEDLSEYM